MSALTRILDLLFPPKCPFCRRLLGEGERVCARCRGTLPYTGDRAEQSVDFIPRVVSALWYEGTVRSSLHRYKFGGISSYAPAYGEMLAATVKERLDGAFDVITWVPLSRRRYVERGYDQAELLARALGSAAGAEVTPLLDKIRHTPAQSGRGGEAERRANVSGCYRSRSPGEIAGKRILLVDDIVTTGATLSEAARILRLAGAEEVLAATLARTRKKSHASDTDR